MLEGRRIPYVNPLTNTDSVKKSKRGRLELIQTDYGTWETRKKSSEVLDVISPDAPYGNKLKVRYENGRQYNRTTFEEVRERAAKGIM